MLLTEPAREFVLHWGEMGSRWGVNRTVAQVHALLYLSAEPLTAEDIAEALAVARSNVSTCPFCSSTLLPLTCRTTCTSEPGEPSSSRGSFTTRCAADRTRLIPSHATRANCTALCPDGSSKCCQ